MIRPVSALALCGALALSVPASAAPVDVRQYVTGGAVTFVTGSDKVVYEVSVSVSFDTGQTTNSYSYLLLAIAKCTKAGKCPVAVTYQAPLASGQASANDLSNFSVTVPAFGKPLTVTWTGAGPATRVDTAPNFSTTSVDFQSAWDATAKIQFLGATCSGAVVTAVSAARHTTIYPQGYTPPSGHTALPVKAAPGAPAKATGCKVGPK